MNYQRIYNEIISFAVTRVKPADYYERHHILPRSMGGTNDEYNLVYLTGREHYICHWLLYKLHKTSKMAYAWHLMTSVKGTTTGRYTSKTFEYAKKCMAAHKSKDMMGENNPMYGLTSKSKGVPRSKEIRDSISKSRRSAVVSDSGMQAIKDAGSKSVTARDTEGVEYTFESTREAIRQGYATDSASVSMICTGYISKSGKRRLTHNGYSWKFTG